MVVMGKGIYVRIELNLGVGGVKREQSVEEFQSMSWQLVTHSKNGVHDNLEHR